MSFCGFIKGISTKICILCVPVKINKRSFEPFSVYIKRMKKNTDLVPCIVSVGLLTNREKHRTARNRSCNQIYANSYFNVEQFEISSRLGGLNNICP